jgi:hypothetical protein
MGVVGAITVPQRPWPLVSIGRLQDLDASTYAVRVQLDAVARGVAEDDSVCRPAECRFRQLTSVVTNRGVGRRGDQRDVDAMPCPRAA